MVLARRGGHSIGIRRHDQTMDMLHTPVMFHQFEGKVVEQAGQRRFWTA